MTMPPGAVTAAAERIVQRRLATLRWSNGDHEAHRAALMTDALADATVALRGAEQHLAATAGRQRAELRDLRTAQSVAAAWCEGYGLGRDDEADGLPLREYASRPQTATADTGPQRSEAEAAFLAASVAVWREIDHLDAQPDGYHPIRMSVELRKAERAAWERYRDEIGDQQ